MKKVLISSFDMEVGGVERSLINMLENFDYKNYDVDLMLYSHSGDFMKFLPKKHNLLSEIKQYKTFRLSIGETIKRGNLALGIGRIAAKYKAINIGKKNKLQDNSYIQMQYMWKYALPFLPKLKNEYDVAISYLWPHYFIAEKVNAKTKIAWIHTDYSIIDTNIKLDLEMWDKFDAIVAVSYDCKKAFLSKYPLLEKKVIVIENITSPDFIKNLSNQYIDELHNEDEIFKVVSVGRYSHAKGFDNAIVALKILHEKGYKNIKWYVVGYGPDEDMLKDIINENELQDSFILLGKKTNPYPYMKLCDLYVQPSRYEGKAVTVGESQILGKSVMITNYTTAKSQVRHMEDGYICDLSIEGIANGIEKLYINKELRNSLSDNCIRKDYSNNYELDKLYEIINKFDTREDKVC